MASNQQHISLIFQKVIEKFESADGFLQCGGNKGVQDEIAAYLLILGRLFGKISGKAQKLKNRYSQDVCKVGGHQTYRFPKSVLNAYWEMKGVSNVLISLQVNIASRLLDSSEVFSSLEDLASWLVASLENFSFQDKIDNDDFGEGCLPVLERIKKKLIMVIGEADIDSLRVSLDENWV